ncbi:MAG: hypothetical protein ACREN5_16405, partial [Gemmatimonadales bacterium]
VEGRPMPMTWISPVGLLFLTAGPATAIAGRGGGDFCAPSKSPFGPTVVVPVEFAQGVTLGRGAPAPYGASIRLYPTYVLDRAHQVRIAIAGGGALVNPRVEALVGGRLSTSVYEFPAGPIRGVGVHVAIEALYGTSDRGLLGVMLIGDAGGAFQATIRAARDVTNRATLLELGLGFHVYDRSPPDRAPVLPAPPRDYLGRVAESMTIALKAAIGTARNENVTACRTLISAARNFVSQPSSAVTTIPAFREALGAGGLALVESLMSDPPPAPEGVTELEVVQALYRGVDDVLRGEPGP